MCPLKITSLVLYNVAMLVSGFQMSVTNQNPAKLLL